jgi:hypothetical protein
LTDKKINIAYQKLMTYCEVNDYKGFDPYDGLNSKLFQFIPFLSKHKICRLIWIQLFKKSPINFRFITGVKKDYNPKALGLFLSSYCLLYKKERDVNHLNKINFFIKKIIELQSKGYSGASWGYNFDWQAKAFFQPRYMPTVVASSFIANALLDAYEINNDKILLDLARSTCDFILKDLNRTNGKNDDFGLSYSPIDNSVVFNASLLGARLLARVYHFTKEEHLIINAKNIVNFVCSFQKENGSWSYGTLPFHQWIDNFHTGYNLECIADYIKFSNDKSYSNNLTKGFDYYINNFFTNDGKSKYYNNKIYPIDIHAPSQLIITLLKLEQFDEYKEMAKKVIYWTIDHMQDKRGYFYYQKNRLLSSRIPYMRWSQAWMFNALTCYIYR